MASKFHLKTIEGNAKVFVIVNDGHYEKDRYGNIISFDVRYNNGDIVHYVASKEQNGGIVKSFFKSYLDQLAGIGGGAAAGRIFGTPGIVLGAFSGYVASKALEHFVLNDCVYFDAKTGQAIFYGPINVRNDVTVA